ncbi:hypothetical protein [Acinetobacter pollinis]|uniref:hypothetical protein n=1 Tax=Acinetobacter pollinis TaxID=2605270 RepID=UPI0018A2E8C2|nr:hypothetical protein [Acinetobacter pollinis]MBF7690545.1 hypothetical protein [Acinetobacter pollinis]MBF7698029.1 hypothetical protein [Acinetobacter pollinis]
MFPISRKIGIGVTGININYFGSDNTPRKVQGSIKKQGSDYSNCLVGIFDRNQLSLLASVKPKLDGSYVVRGLNKDLTLFIVAFDNQTKFNAVIQDMVVPK